MTSHPDGYLTIDAAAVRLARHRRTVHRLLEAGALESAPDAYDRRRTLIAEESIQRFLDGITNTSGDLASAQEDRSQGLAADIQQLLGDLDRYQETLADRLDSPAGKPRDSELGLALDTLRLDVTGVQDDPDAVRVAVQIVRNSLFPIYLYLDGAPDSFITLTPIGRMLAEAELNLEKPGEWISVNAMMDHTGRPRSWVENALRAHGSPRLFDPRHNRWLYHASFVDVFSGDDVGNDR